MDILNLDTRLPASSNMNLSIHLTTLERKTLQLAIQGHKIAQVASQFCCSPSKVKRLRASLLKKFGAPNIEMVVSMAIRMKLID